MSGILKGSKDEFTTNTMAEIEGQKIRFSATYKRRDWSESSRIADEVSRALADDAPTGWEKMKNILRDDLVGWSKLQGEGGDVPFNDENLEAALSIYGYLSALYRGWNAAQMQQPSAHSKN